MAAWHFTIQLVAYFSVDHTNPVKGEYVWYEYSHVQKQLYETQDWIKYKIAKYKYT